MLEFRAGMEIHISPYNCECGGGLDLQPEIKQVIHALQFPDIPLQGVPIFFALRLDICASIYTTLVRARKHLYSEDQKCVKIRGRKTGGLVEEKTDRSKMIHVIL